MTVCFDGFLRFEAGCDRLGAFRERSAPVGRALDSAVVVPGESPSPRQLIGLGATLVGFVVLGLVGGIALDSWLHSTPVWTMVGLFLGVLGAVGTAFGELRKFLR